MSSEPHGQMMDAQAEAARYALIRRLVPVLRHHMVVNLQPMSMICEVMERKLAGTGSDVAAVHNGIGKINHLARAAIDGCLDVVSWLAPEADAMTPLGAGVVECLDLVRSNFTFRGFTLVNEVGEFPATVPQMALREVLIAVLLAYADEANGLDEVVLGARTVAADTPELSLKLRRGAGSSHNEEGVYRNILWGDVQALAQAHGIALARQPDGAVVLRLMAGEKPPAHGAPA